MPLSEFSEEVATLKSLVLRYLDETNSLLQEVRRMTEILDGLRAPAFRIPDREQ